MGLVNTILLSFLFKFHFFLIYTTLYTTIIYTIWYYWYTESKPLQITYGTG